MRLFRTAALVVAIALLSGCGKSGTETAETSSEAHKQLRRLTVALDSWESPETAGILMAQENGYFADVGLQVASTVPSSPDRSIEYVVNGTDDLGVVQEPQVVMARAEGAPIVIIGSVIPQPTAAMIWLKKSKIHGIADLKGKTIAIPGLPFQRKFLEALLSAQGLAPGEVTIKDVGRKLVPALISGRADAIFGGSANLEGIELESRGVMPVITGVQDLGVPAYDELVVIAPADPLLEDPQLFRNFNAALSRGTVAAVKEPEAVVGALERAAAANPSTSSEALRAQVAATVPLLSRNGYMSHSQGYRLVDWMHMEGMTRFKVGVATLLTDYYLGSPRLR